ncbi:hypothetical protein F0231_19685 [Vibrio sp. RE86]|uniref:hypothetical protein n=1 Tax=Vibrio sp. RE86 TaxID=2607605 RepID=UPI0014939716|nr:hypothetical protein [Vibrio sp. RE86]NOH81954.1 hypothetical protein [Vibrio sp. RE86]
MNTTNNKLYASVMTLLLLGGCGGGGGGDEGSTSGSSGSTSTPSGEDSSTESATTPASQSVSITDLQIDHDNSLTSVYEVNIDVSLPHLSASQVYVSICDNSGGGYDNIDYDQCMVKAALNSGYGSYQLSVPNHCESLIAVISVMEPNTDPLVYVHNHNGELDSSWLIQ